MKTGLYIHIPFCEKKCYYCDFYSASADKITHNEYLDALLSESNVIFRSAHEDMTVKTVYIGGGTPTCLDNGVLSKMYKALSFDKSRVEEFTVEGNPNSYTDNKISEYLDMGVTRTSVGVQCLSDRSLKALGRMHNAGQAISCLENLVKAGFDVSADYMVGVPFQNTDIVKEDIKKITDTGVKHVSCYSLILEKGTRLYSQAENKEIGIPSEDEAVDMYDVAKELLEKNGLMRYETSNFGKPCLHNLGYWQMNEYIGLGVSAHSLLYKTNYEKIFNEIIADNNVEAVRYFNKNDIGRYIDNFKNDTIADGRSVREKESNLTLGDMIEETVMLGLRTERGINLLDFADRYGLIALNKLLKRADFQRQYLIVSEHFINIKPEYAYVANSIISELI